MFSSLFVLDDEVSPEPSRLSWCDSLPRQSSSISNMPEKMRPMKSSSLQGSKHSVGWTKRQSISKSPHGTLDRTQSHLSRGSEASFYSCGSFLDELDLGYAYVFTHLIQSRDCASARITAQIYTY